MATEGELRNSNNMDDSEKVREIQEQVAELKAEVTSPLMLFIDYTLWYPRTQCDLLVMRRGVSTRCCHSSKVFWCNAYNIKFTRTTNWNVFLENVDMFKHLPHGWHDKIFY